MKSIIINIIIIIWLQKLRGYSDKSSVQNESKKVVVVYKAGEEGTPDCYRQFWGRRSKRRAERSSHLLAKS